MDIDLMSKMVKELILNREEVCLQGVGSFITEIVPSTFSDKGYTINPPYRRLVFRQKLNPSDNSLARLYAEANDLDIDRATLIISNFLTEMKEVLQTKKTIILPGLGRLRATKENHFFFVADEELDIWPDGFGLEPISLKTHIETADEVASVVHDLKELLSETEAAEATMIEAKEVEATEAETKVAAPTTPAEIAEIAESKTAEDTSSAETAAKDSRAKGRAIFRIMLTILAIAVVALAAFVLLSRFAPELIDSILYNKEDLEFLRNQHII